MTRTDDEILEELRETGAGTPKSLSETLDRHNDYIGVRCRKLAAYGLITRKTRGFYVINDTGTGYLMGDLDASTLESGA